MNAIDEPHPERTPRNKRISLEELLFAIKDSPSVYEAAREIGVLDSAINKVLKREGIMKPSAWNQHWKENVGRLRRLHLASIIETQSDRLCVATILGTEGTITCGYDKTIDSTGLKIQVGMTDRPWVEKFARPCGVGSPLRLSPKYQCRKDVWVSQLDGLCALLVLKDVRPFLLGGKPKEALRAIDYFSPTGYQKGRLRARDIWNPSDYPWKDSHSTEEDPSHFAVLPSGFAHS